MTSRLVVRFSGEDADQHRLLAYDGANSLLGIAGTITIVGYFLSNDKVRHRSPFDSSYNFYMKPLRNGSIESIFDYEIISHVLLVIGGAATQLPSNIMSSALYDLLKTVFRRSIGKDRNSTLPQLRAYERDRGGNIDALVEAVAPAIKDAHSVIGNGSRNIIIVNGDNNIIKLSPRTKEYVETNIVDENSSVLTGNIASLNANTGYGRIYIPDFGRTIPFSLKRPMVNSVMSELSGNLDDYVNGVPNDITVVGLVVRSADNTPKKIIISRVA